MFSFQLNLTDISLWVSSNERADQNFVKIIPDHSGGKDLSRQHEGYALVTFLAICAALRRVVCARDPIRLRRLIVLRSIDGGSLDADPRVHLSRANQPPRVSRHRVEAAAQRSARTERGYSREIGTHPKVYIRRHTRCCRWREQPDTLETDRPLWTPMLPQRGPVRRTIVYGARYSISLSRERRQRERERERGDDLALPPPFDSRINRNCVLSVLCPLCRVIHMIHDVEVVYDSGWSPSVAPMCRSFIKRLMHRWLTVSSRSRGGGEGLTEVTGEERERVSASLSPVEAAHKSINHSRGASMSRCNEARARVSLDRRSRETNSWVTCHTDPGYGYMYVSTSAQCRHWWPHLSGEAKATTSRWFNSQGRLGRRAIPFISIHGPAGIQDARSQEVAAIGMTLPSRQDQRTPQTSRDGGGGEEKDSFVTEELRIDKGRKQDGHSSGWNHRWNKRMYVKTA